MRLDLDDDQLAVVELFAGFFARECPPALVRSSEGLGYAPVLWERLEELGAGTMSLPEARGGGGGGLLDVVLATEAAGRCLAPVPLVEHTVALRLLERVGAGAPAHQHGPVTIALRPAGEVARQLPFGAVAPSFLACSGDRLVIVAGDPPGRALPNGSGLAIADRALAGATELLRGDGAVAAHARAVDEWRLLTASMLVGLADAALAMGVAYVSERHQFGVPIGSFQAIQHGLAELPGQISGARLLVARAAWRLDSGADERFAVDAAMALHFTTELARTVTARVLHYHGGYGVMEEYDIQLHHRRARGWPAQVGDPATELDRAADLLYGPVGVA